jgi:transketolase
VTRHLSSTGYGYDDLPGLIALMEGDEKHGASAHSTLDVIWVLYDRVLDVSPDGIADPDRDRLLLSKGHGPMAYYAVLAAKGLIPVDELPRFGAYDSLLGYHPDRVLAPGVEISSGSLGHGLPIAVGVTLGLRAQGRSHPRVVCLVGDAELEEGSNFEAIQLAGRVALDRLTVVVIDNGSSTYGWPGGISERFVVEGWRAQEVDGRDRPALEQALAPPDDRCPTAVVAAIGRGLPGAA